MSSHGDYCRCRKRKCDSPAPANGGLACSGSALVVTNCTQHGGWTAWSEWSACSQTCGTGLKTRHRQCGNPVPAHGGKVCVGRDVDEQYCEDLAPCDHHTAGSLWDKRPGDSGAWTQWSAWSQCSAQCGRGLRSRQRSCRGIGCSGCDKDWAECEDTACTGHNKVTETTPWVNISRMESGGWEEKRWSFTFTAASASQVRHYSFSSDCCNSCHSKFLC